MSGKICAATRNNPSPKEAKAYAEGRLAAVQLALSTTNPHPDNTPESLAWFRGWDTWEAAGTDRFQDCTAYPVRLTDRTGTVEEDPGDATGLTWDTTLMPGTPCYIHWGDGTVTEHHTGYDTHVYPPVTQDYTVTWVLGSIVLDSATAAVVYVPPAP